MSSFILNRFTVNTNGDNLKRTCYSEKRRDNLIIKLATVYRWNENLPLELMKQNHFSSFSFISNNIFHYSFQQEKSEHISESFLCMFFLRKQGYHVTNFAMKTKVSSYKCWRWKNKIITFYLLGQRINEFKMNEI